ncbi:hypothetical protein [Kitasatospora sp. SC0581]|uniref:hypothetical protein n=1 Tax=Kitasatospora sp. SC0581 TaxID=3394360 RepID=UPI003A83C5F7
MLRPDAVVAELGGGAVLLGTAHPAAAYLGPTALGWLRGRPPAPGHRDQHSRCLTQWHNAGLVTLPGTSAPTAPTDLQDTATTHAQGLPHPMLVIAMSATCGYCTQLSADIAANTNALDRLDTSVLLVDGENTRALGAPVPAPVRDELAHLARQAARRGTPTAVLLTPGRPAEVLSGFPDVSAALVALTGADPRATVIETPTSCSVNQATRPVDALLTVRPGGRRVGIAVRGDEAHRIVRETTGARPDDAYTPVTLTVERPDAFHLLFRGGELLTRARTPDALRRTLTDVLAAYAPAQPDELRLLCAAADHADGHAVLLPRNWMSDLVKNARRLEQHGWHVRPEPYTTLRTDPADGAPHLVRPRHRGPAALPVRALLAEAPGTGGVPTRTQVLAHAVNWIARPTTPDAVHTLAASLRTLPVHVGTWQDALAHLAPSFRRKPWQEPESRRGRRSPPTGPTR